MPTILGYHNSASWLAATTGECTQTLSGHADKICSALFSVDGCSVLTASYDKTAKIWNSSTGECAQTLSGHLECVVGAVPDGRAASDAGGNQQDHVLGATRVSGGMGVAAGDGSSMPERRRDVPCRAVGRSVLDRRPGDPDPNELADWYKEELAQDAGEMEVDAETNNEMNTDFVGNFTVANGLGMMEPSFDDEVSTMFLIRNWQRGTQPQKGIVLRRAAHRHGGVLTTEDYQAHPREQDAARDAGICP